MVWTKSMKNYLKKAGIDAEAIKDGKEAFGKTIVASYLVPGTKRPHKPQMTRVLAKDTDGVIYDHGEGDGFQLTGLTKAKMLSRYVTELI